MALRKESHSSYENHLLAALTDEEYRRLSPHLELVRLPAGKILYEPGDKVRYAYFLKGGMVSLLSTTHDGRSVEVGMIGNEGLAGMPIIFGVSQAPYKIMVQLQGHAMRIKAEALRGEFKRGGHLHDLLLHYAHTLLTQIAQSAACNRFHTVEERLCRWLLVSRDRVQTDTLHLTQEFISHMMGVPRTSVTAIASGLQKEGIIRHSRGKITILDRRRLETVSCECYRLVSEEIRHLSAA
jgi:CRP-like cAMP-binding protein